MRPKYSLSLSVGAVLLVLMSACASSNQTTPTQATLDGVHLTRYEVNLLQEAKAQGHQDVVVLDAGHGQQQGGSFLFKIKLGEGDFGLKDSKSGFSQRLLSHIDNFYVALIDAGPPAPSGLINSVDFETLIPKGTLTGGGNNERAILFKNVPSSSNRYYVAVAAVTSPDTNITNQAGQITLGASLAIQGKAYISTGGGDPSNSGSVRVGSPSTYLIPASDLPTLTMTMKLADETGATIDSKVTITAGNSGYVGPITVE